MARQPKHTKYWQGCKYCQAHKFTESDHKEAIRERDKRNPYNLLAISAARNNNPVFRRCVERKERENECKR